MLNMPTPNTRSKTKASNRPRSVSSTTTPKLGQNVGLKSPKTPKSAKIVKRGAENEKSIEPSAKKRKSEPVVLKETGNVAAKENGRHEKRSEKIDEEEIDDVDEKILKDLGACFSLAMTPEEFPCREEEVRGIRNFILGNLDAKTSGCAYISGVPGTGKTASVKLVVQQLERKKSLPDFVFVELNGMLVSDPKRIFVNFYKALHAKKGFFESAGRARRGPVSISPAAATKKLEHMFEMSDDDRPAVVLLLDEIDALVTKRQQYLYRILNWSTQQGAKLIVVAIANTLDLPERVLSNRNHSRMGLQRFCFKPYNFKQIGDILTSRLRQKPDAVEEDAVEYIARKVASVSGDVRRAFEICRLAIDVALSKLDVIETAPQATPGRRKSQRQRRCGRVTRANVEEALKSVAKNPKVQAIQHASTQEKLLLEAAVTEYRRTGSDELAFNKIWFHYKDICRDLDSVTELGVDELLDVTNRLAECRLLICCGSSNEGMQDFTARFKLNVNPGDFELALRKDQIEGILI